MVDPPWWSPATGTPGASCSSGADEDRRPQDLGRRADRAARPRTHPAQARRARARERRAPATWAQYGRCVQWMEVGDLRGLEEVGDP